MLTPEDLQQIKARYEATLDPDWHNEWTHCDMCDPDNDWYEVDGPDYDRDRETPYFTEPHAAFIAHAHQDIPALLAEVERLQEQVAWQQTSLDSAETAQQTLQARAAELEARKPLTDHWHDEHPQGIPPGSRETGGLEA